HPAPSPIHTLSLHDALPISQRVREMVREEIIVGVASKNLPLLPVLNRYEPFVTTDNVEDQTTRPIVRLTKSHLNAAILWSDDERSEEHTSELQSRFDLVCRL